MPSGVYERDPELLCTAGDCGNYRLKGLTVCKFHGGATPASVTVRARAEIAEQAGMALPEVKPQDFPKIAANMIAWNLRQVALLSAEMETMRADGSYISHAREYGDLLDRVSKWNGETTKLMNAAAALGVQYRDDGAEKPPVELIRTALEGIRQRRSNSIVCVSCGQEKVRGEVVPGSVVSPKPNPDWEADAQAFVAEPEGLLDDEIAEAKDALL